MNCFHRNLNLYAKKSPQIAVKLSYVNTDHYQFCETSKGELNLCANVHGKIKSYHSESGAVAEASAWFSSLNLKEKEVLYVYGIGLGYYYEAVKSWLRINPKRHLIFLESDPAVICKFFETEKAKELLNDKQVELHFFQGVESDQDKLLFERLSWHFINQPYLVSALQYYSHERKEIYSQLNHKIPYDASYNSDYVDEYMLYGVAFYRNFYRNILRMPGSYFGNKLFGKFKNVPAIICGAGPSLQKQLPLLRTLTNQALIFAGGSALNALSHEGILPHFGLGVDPNEEQYKRLASSSGFEVPFFFRTRMNHHAFMTIHGPKLYLSGSGGYETATWFDKKLKLQGKSLEEGNNVVNFSLELAQCLGCNPIIFVGVDLAYTGMQSYAPGIIEDASIDKQMLEKDRAFLRENINGEQVYTVWKWIAESEWIGDYAKNHPKLHIFNATEGGIGFPAIENISLKDVVHKYLTKQYDLRGRVHGEIQNGTIKSLETDRIIRLMKKFSRSLEKVVRYLDQLIEEEKELLATLKVNKKNEIPPSSGIISLIENEIVSEPAYEFGLDIFNQMYMRANYRDVEKLNRLAKKGVTVSSEKLRIAFNQKRYDFLKLTANMNQYLIQDALAEFAKEGS